VACSTRRTLDGGVGSDFSVESVAGTIQSVALALNDAVPATLVTSS
jgi:hypothetical protein